MATRIEHDIRLSHAEAREVAAFLREYADDCMGKLRRLSLSAPTRALIGRDADRARMLAVAIERDLYSWEA